MAYVEAVLDLETEDKDEDEKARREATTILTSIAFSDNNKAASMLPS